MKDVYELFNHVSVDEADFVEMEVTDLEKAKVKQALHQSIRGSKTKQRKKQIVAAAFIGVSVTTIGLTLPASADSIPIIKDVFKFFDTEKFNLSKERSTENPEKPGLYHDYKKYAKELNISKQINGVTFTIRDAVYDGKTVSLTYSIESDQDLGGQPVTSSGMKIQGVTALSISDRISRVDEHSYVGLVTMSNVEGEIGELAKVKWGIDRIQTEDKQKGIDGPWDFEFSLPKAEVEEIGVNRSVEQDGVKVSIEKISTSPMSFVVYYNQKVAEKIKNTWDEAYVELTIKDDLGNVYIGEGNGGKGQSNYDVDLSTTFQKIDPKATKLIVTPHVRLWNHTLANYGQVEMINGVFREVPVVEKSGINNKKFDLEELVIDVKK